MPQDRRHQQGARHGAPAQRAQRRMLPLAAGALALAVVVAVVAALMTGGDDDGDREQAAVDVPDVAVTWTAEPFSGGPRLAVDQSRVDRGSVDYGEQVQAIYRLKNVGDEELRIGQTSVNTLEGC